METAPLTVALLNVVAEHEIITLTHLWVLIQVEVWKLTIVSE